MRRLFATEPLAKRIHHETVPGPGVQTDQEILGAGLTIGGCGYHAIGTCAIGPNDDDVVDPRLRVRGVANLRVVDASVLPVMVSGNLNGPVSALAWRAADFILELGGRLTARTQAPKPLRSCTGDRACAGAVLISRDEQEKQVRCRGPMTGGTMSPVVSNRSPGHQGARSSLSSSAWRRCSTSSTTSRASRRRPVGVSTALTWDTKTSGSVSARLTIGSGTCGPNGTSRRDRRERSMSRQMRATTVVSQPLRFWIALVSERLRCSQASCTASSTSLSEPSMR
jgi:hypothetical protein